MTEKKHIDFWELATAKLYNEADEKELHEFDQLFEEEKNKKLFSELEKLKTDVAKVKVLAEVSKEKSWYSIYNKVRSKTVRLVWNMVKYAAIVVLALGIGILITNQWNKAKEISGFAEVKVPLGQMSEMTLFDGTKVWLNSGTTLRYNSNFGEKERNVSLEGEAFFDVTKTGTPFKVKFKGKEVEVLGTRFNVMAYKDQNMSSVTLVEGKVNVNNSMGSTIAMLSPSEQMIIDEESKKATINNVETTFYISWTEGKIVFEEEKLADIVKRLERWYNVEIRFGDETIKDLTFSGTILRNKPFEQIITAFELLLPVQIEYTHVLGDKDVVQISKK